MSEAGAGEAQLTADRKSIIVPVSALEPLLNALCSLEEDAERGAALSGLGIDAPAYGRNWALWRARTRLDYRELKKLKDCIWSAIQHSPATRFGTVSAAAADKGDANVENRKRRGERGRART